MPMPKFEDVAPSAPFLQQQEIDVEGPVVLLNTFTVPSDKADEMLENWREDASIMKQQPGFISAQMHRAVGSPDVMVKKILISAPDTIYLYSASV